MKSGISNNNANERYFTWQCFNLMSLFLKSSSKVLDLEFALNSESFWGLASNSTISYKQEIDWPSGAGWADLLVWHVLSCKCHLGKLPQDMLPRIPQSHGADFQCTARFWNWNEKGIQVVPRKSPNLLFYWSKSILITCCKWFITQNEYVQLTEILTSRRVSGFSFFT